MRKYILLFLVAVASYNLSNAQCNFGEGTFQINAGMDLWNTNNNPIRFANTIRTDIDFNYFVSEKFTVGLGFDYSTALRRTNFSPGFRLYLGNSFFFRTKAYIGPRFNSLDIGPGIGNDFALSDNWAIEANADWLIRARAVYLRMGFAVFL